MPEPVYRILLVDDEPEVLEALYLTLNRAKQFQCEVRKAGGGPEALELLGKQPAQLVLADFRMPKMTGVELLKAVRERWPETVRCLITGYSDVEIAMQAMEQARIHYYVQKPWNNDELRLTVWEALKSYKGT
ncbi:MAG TPA: response regulator [Candidatus Thermoplasmatota archaeon]|jgi:YesN/AraC family two-component response regulator|nr:response regulator [Candidatus Thermoplasmatota archaeon]